MHTIKNPQYSDELEQSITGTIQHPRFGEIPYTAIKGDGSFDLAVKGGKVGKFTPKPKRKDTVSVDLYSPKNTAWAMLRGNADLEGSWPELKSALNKAVESLDGDATASDIYAESVSNLSNTES